MELTPLQKVQELKYLTNLLGTTLSGLTCLNQAELQLVIMTLGCNVSYLDRIETDLTTTNLTTQKIPESSMN